MTGKFCFTNSFFLSFLCFKNSADVKTTFLIKCYEGVIKCYKYIFSEFNNNLLKTLHYVISLLTEQNK